MNATKKRYVPIGARWVWTVVCRKGVRRSVHRLYHDNQMQYLVRADERGVFGADICGAVTPQPLSEALPNDLADEFRSTGWTVHTYQAPEVTVRSVQEDMR
jgi:hypothetical protein